jgi:hypothetical protein
MARAIYDWLTISKEYIQGIEVKNVTTGNRTLKFPTHEELCEKHGCAILTIRAKSQEEKWTIQRAQFKRKLKIKSSEVCLDDLIGEGTRFDSLHLSSLEKIQKLIDFYLEPYITGINNGFENIENLTPITPRDLKDITIIIKDSHNTVRSILGEGTTASLLEDITNDLIVQRRNKEISKTRLKELTKQLNDAEKLKEELELRKKEVHKQLSEKNNETNKIQQTKKNS